MNVETLDKYDKYDIPERQRGGGGRKKEGQGDNTRRRLKELQEEGGQRARLVEAQGFIERTFPRVDVTVEQGMVLFEQYVEFVRSLIRGPELIVAEEVVIERVSGTGSGGQNVNRKKRGVRLTHIPTGIQKVTRDKLPYEKNLENVRNDLENELMILRDAWRVVMGNDFDENKIWSVYEKVKGR